MKITNLRTIEATVFGDFLDGLLANFDIWSFLPEMGVFGAEGIFSHKSLGSLIAGLTIGTLVLVLSRKEVETLRVEVDDDLTSSLSFTMIRTLDLYCSVTDDVLK